MKIPADQVLRTWTGPPALGAASQSYGLTTVNLASWMQGDTLGKSEMMILSKSLMKPITNLCSQLNIAPPNSLFDMTNDYLFEMNMTFVSKWGFAPAWYSHSALCKLSFAIVNDKLQEAEYDNHRLPKAGARTVFSKWFMTIFSRAEPFLSDGSQIETARRQGRRAVISRA